MLLPVTTFFTFPNLFLFLFNSLKQEIITFFFLVIRKSLLIIRYFDHAEYGMGNEVWTQGDVYSYGILLLEMFTGRRPTDNMFEGASNLHSFVKEALPREIINIIAPILVLDNTEAEIGTKSHTSRHSTKTWVKIEESLIGILEVGVACSAEFPRERLDISVVVAEMCRIRNKFTSIK